MPDRWHATGTDLLVAVLILAGLLFEDVIPMGWALGILIQSGRVARARRLERDA